MFERDTGLPRQAAADCDGWTAVHEAAFRGLGRLLEEQLLPAVTAAADGDRKAAAKLVTKDGLKPVDLARGGWLLGLAW